MVGGGEGMEVAYWVEYKMMTATSPSSSSLANRRPVLHAADSDLVPLVRSWIWGHGCGCRCRVWAPFVVRQSLAALLSFASLLGGRWRSLGGRLLGAGLRSLLCVWLSSCWAGCCTSGRPALFVVVWVA